MSAERVDDDMIERFIADVESDATAGHLAPFMALELKERRSVDEEIFRLLEGCIDDLAQRETDPSMLDGHRARVAELKRIVRGEP